LFKDKNKETGRLEAGLLDRIHTLYFAAKRCDEFSRKEAHPPSQGYGGTGKAQGMKKSRRGKGGFDRMNRIYRMGKQKGVATKMHIRRRKAMA
jgi:hypothetical protein